MLASSYPFMDVMWTMFVFFLWVIVIMIEVMILFDNFRRKDHGGLAKAMWVVLIIFLPLLGALIYIATRPRIADEDYVAV